MLHQTYSICTEEFDQRVTAKIPALKVRDKITETIKYADYLAMLAKEHETLQGLFDR